MSCKKPVPYLQSGTTKNFLFCIPDQTSPDCAAVSADLNATVNSTGISRKNIIHKKLKYGLGRTVVLQ